MSLDKHRPKKYKRAWSGGKVPRVEAKCIGCGAKKYYGPHEIPLGEHPMCECGMPMVAVRAIFEP